MILGLEILLGLAFAVFVAPVPSAANETGTNYSFQSGNNPIVTQYSYQYQTPANTYQTPSTVYPTPAQTVAPVTTRIVYYPAPERAAVASTAKATTPSTEEEDVKPIVTKNQDTNKYSSLAANAVFGEVGFLPTGLVQWIMVAILILLIVVLVRKVFGGAKGYYASPLKHS